MTMFYSLWVIARTYESIVNIMIDQNMQPTKKIAEYCNLAGENFIYTESLSVYNKILLKTAR